MNILVTGANGQLGSEIRFARKSSEDCYFFTDVSDLDITNIDAVRKFSVDKSIQIIINCAAYTNVDRAEDEADKANLINHIAVSNLANVCKDCDITLFHISTDYVFNGKNNIPYVEQDKADPIGVYGKTKFAAEKAILESRCKALIFRTSWLYSSFGNNFVKTMVRLTSEKTSLNVIFDQVGTPTYAADLAETLISIIKNRSYSGLEGTYHFSNEGVCSWYDFAYHINNMANHKCKITPCHTDEFPSKVSRPHYSVLDKTKLKLAFGITVPYWTESLEKCMRIINK